MRSRLISNYYGIPFTCVEGVVGEFVHCISPLCKQNVAETYESCIVELFTLLYAHAAAAGLGINSDVDRQLSKTIFYNVARARIVLKRHASECSLLLVREVGACVCQIQIRSSFFVQPVLVRRCVQSHL